MDLGLLAKTPAVLVVGSPGVGKRTLLSRLLNVDFEDEHTPSSELLVHGWTIKTKYYTADVSVCMAHISDELSISNLPIVDRIVALVMVFDVSDHSSLAALKNWVSRTEILKFDIMLCIGNKVDLLPGHPAHTVYKRCLLKHGESSDSPQQDFSKFGISDSEGSSLLGGEESSWEFKKPCLEWCLEHNIEYVEACASNSDFDKCLSVDGDSQGVERLYGALSAHMWPGMVLKSGNQIDEPSLPEQEGLSEEESDYEPEYEKLSSESGEPCDEAGWVSADGPVLASESGRPLEHYSRTPSNEAKADKDESQPSTSACKMPENLMQEESTIPHETDRTSVLDEDRTYELDDLEKLMSEIGNIRNGLRLMPDFQRREMAAKLAIKMAAMFGDSSDGEEDLINENEKI